MTTYFNDIYSDLLTTGAKANDPATVYVALLTGLSTFDRVWKLYKDYISSSLSLSDLDIFLSLSDDQWPKDTEIR